MKTKIIDIEELEQAIIKVVGELDDDQLAKLGEQLLGGSIEAVSNGEFRFKSNKNYNGAFDKR